MKLYVSNIRTHNIDFKSSSTATIASTSTKAPRGSSATARATLEGNDFSGKYDPYIAFTLAKSDMFYVSGYMYF